MRFVLSGRVWKLGPRQNTKEHDLDTSLVHDGRWIYAWDAGSRLVDEQKYEEMDRNGTVRYYLSYGI